MRKFFHALLYIFAALYPVFIFVCIVVFKIPPRITSLCVIVLGITFFLSFTGKQKKNQDETSGKKKKAFLDWRPLATSLLIFAGGMLGFLTKETFFLKLYSASISVMFLIVFGSTLIFKPNMIFRFATLADKTVIGSSFEKDVYKYCRNVTIIWCIFFIFNGTLSTITAFSKEIFKVNDDTANAIWSVYNGVISYALIGILFSSELFVRRIVNKRMVKPFPLSSYKYFSRKQNLVLCCVEGEKKSKGKTWKDFLMETAALKNHFKETCGEKTEIPFCDEWIFLVSFTAAIQAGKIPVVSLEKKSDVDFEKIIESNLVTDKKIYFDVPEINAEKSEIVFRSGEGSKTIFLSEIESKISGRVSEEGKKLVRRKNPAKIKKDSVQSSVEELLLIFTLGLKFYRNGTDNI